MWFRLAFIIVALGAQSSLAFLENSLPTSSGNNRQISVRAVEKELEDLDEARRQLEEMIRPSIFPPSLTAGARRRLELEIELLEALVESDEPVDYLMDLWIHEYPLADREIEVIRFLEKECPDGAESVLRGMVESFPEWPEPAARLAFLVGLKERVDEAQTYVDAVLSRKPWHFEVQHMQVLFALQKSDFPQALRCARQRLPPTSCPRRREAWVRRSVNQARQQLDQLEASRYPPQQSSAWQ